MTLEGMYACNKLVCVLRRAIIVFKCKHLIYAHHYLGVLLNMKKVSFFDGSFRNVCNILRKQFFYGFRS